MKNTAIIIIICLLWTGTAVAQFGGSRSFRSLSLAPSPRITALGGKAPAIHTDDINTALDNPAFIQQELHSQAVFSNSFYMAGINYGTIAYARTFDKAGNWLFSARYVSYGEMQGRDDAGNLTGAFRAGDYLVSAGYGNSYRDKWLYGANIKMMYSNLERYNATGIAIDVSGAYHDEDRMLTVSASIRNAGVMLDGYTAGNREQLPMEITVGLSKRFENLPARLNVAFHNLQRPDISFVPPEGTGPVNIFGQEEDPEPGIADKIFRHVILGAEIEVAEPVTLRVGYNHQVRKELSISSSKGFSGISLGVGIHVRQFSIDYAFSNYHPAVHINHIGLKVNLDAFTGKQVKIPDEKDQYSD